MIKIRKKAFLLFTLITMLLILSACNNGSSGKVSSIHTLTVQVDYNESSPLNLKLYDNTGKMIAAKEGESAEFEVENGAYNLKIYNNQTSKIRSFIISGSDRILTASLSDFTISSDNWSPGSGWTLDWSDEFNQGVIESANWTRQELAAGTFNNEWQEYTGSSANSHVQMDLDSNNGAMIIQAKYNGQGLERGNFTSARMITNEKVEYKYGKIAARIKVPEGQGIWPAFWMLGTNISETGGSVDWPACGEIDIMEKIGGNYEKERTVHGTVHFANENHQWEYLGGSKSISEYLSADYHVYEVEWNSDRIIWRLDGEEYHRQDIKGSEFDEFRKPFYLLLNVAVGGEWPGYPDSTTEFPQKMYVDWVRVYK
ncbi:family 16 glycosylhydrolase [Halanaerobium saccharolyticum]|uniref:family 16 glycosylhydrolase n=1 Tax=Halanaerobium saccharolyticum TaxID=43595 RepID=UPI003FCE1EE9